MRSGRTGAWRSTPAPVSLCASAQGAEPSPEQGRARPRSSSSPPRRYQAATKPHRSSTLQPRTRSGTYRTGQSPSWDAQSRIMRTVRQPESTRMATLLKTVTGVKYDGTRQLNDLQSGTTGPRSRTWAAPVASSAPYRVRQTAPRARLRQPCPCRGPAVPTWHHRRYHALRHVVRPLRDCS